MSVLDDVIKEGFGAINNFKRHRALADIKPQDRTYHELQMYKMFDQIELAFRAINNENREAEPTATPMKTSIGQLINPSK